MNFSPAQEDYVEIIWELTQKLGYVRVTDVARALGVKNGSVSRMVQKLDKEGVLIYERYRGIRMTSEGYERGRKMYERRMVIEGFFTCIGVVDIETVRYAVEGMEHFVTDEVMENMQRLTCYIHRNPMWWRQYRNDSGDQCSAAQ